MQLCCVVAIYDGAVRLFCPIAGILLQLFECSYDIALPTRMIWAEIYEVRSDGSTLCRVRLSKCPCFCGKLNILWDVMLIHQTSGRHGSAYKISLSQGSKHAWYTRPMQHFFIDDMVIELVTKCHLKCWT